MDGMKRTLKRAQVAVNEAAYTREIAKQRAERATEDLAAAERYLAEELAELDLLQRLAAQGREAKTEHG